MSWNTKSKSDRDAELLLDALRQSGIPANQILSLLSKAPHNAAAQQGLANLVDTHEPSYLAEQNPPEPQEQLIPQEQLSPMEQLRASSSSYQSETTEQQLDDVAKALGRLMETQESTQTAEVNRAQSSEETQSARIHNVLSALESLDNRITSLADTPQTEAPLQKPIDPLARRLAARKRTLAEQAKHLSVVAPKDAPAHPQAELQTMHASQNNVEDQISALRSLLAQEARKNQQGREEVKHDNWEGQQSRSEPAPTDPLDTASHGRLTAFDKTRATPASALLHQRERDDNPVLVQLQSELSDVRRQLGQHNMDQALQQVENSHAQIVARLEKMSSSQIDQTLLNTVQSRLLDLEGYLSALPRMDHMQALENRLLHMGERLELVLQQAGPSGLENVRADIANLKEVVNRLDPSRMISEVDQRIRFLTARMNELEHFTAMQRDIQARLGEVETRLPDAQAMSRLNEQMDNIANLLGTSEGTQNGELSPLDRIEEHLHAVTTQLTRIETTPQPMPDVESAVNKIDRRLDEICDKVGFLELRLMSAPENGEASQKSNAALIALEEKVVVLTQKLDQSIDTNLGAQALSELQGEVASLRAQLGTLATPQDIEEKIQQLASSVAQPQAITEGASLDKLQTLVTDLATTLDTTNEHMLKLGVLDTSVAQMGATLSELNQQVSVNALLHQDNAPAQLQASALEPVESAIGNLQQDLHTLMETANKDEAANLDRLEDVLGTITERLDALEKHRPVIGSSQLSKDHEKVTSDSQVRNIIAALSKAGKKHSDNADASPEQTHTHESTPATQYAQHGAAETQMQAQEQAQLQDKKAEFIAAARRAAQAATQEVREQQAQHSIEQQPQAEKPRRQRRLRDYLQQAEEERAQVRLSAASQNYGAQSTPALEEEPLALGEEQILKEPQQPLHNTAQRTRPNDPLKTARENLRTAPEPEEKKKTGKRKAVLLAAAALIITIGALQFFKMNSGDKSDAELAISPNAQPVIEAPQELATPQEQEPVRAVPATGTVPLETAPQTQSDTPDNSVVPETRRSPTLPASGGADTINDDQINEDVVSQNSFWQQPGAFQPQQLPAANLVFARNEPVSTISPRHVNALTAVAKGPLSGFSNGLASARPDLLASADTMPNTQATPKQAATIEADRQARQQTTAVLQGAVKAATPRQQFALSDLPKQIGPDTLIVDARQGNPAALFELGKRYTQGQRVPVDLKKAAKYYSLAAKAGLAPAQYRYASLLEKGEGVPKNLAEAMKWYLLAAGQGNVKSMHNLAVLYASGTGTEHAGIPDYVKASKWFRLSASHGVADSQYNLAVLLARGLGQPQDLQASYKWFALAAASGDNDAKTKRDELAQVLTKQQLQAANATVSVFVPKKPEQTANTVPVDSRWQMARKPALQMSTIDMVYQVQQQLASGGYSPGQADGMLGPKTVRAIRQFQQQMGLPETGKIDSALQKALQQEQLSRKKLG